MVTDDTKEFQSFGQNHLEGTRALK
jgi:hypothetical protein